MGSDLWSVKFIQEAVQTHVLDCLFHILEVHTHPLGERHDLQRQRVHADLRSL